MTSRELRKKLQAAGWTITTGGSHQWKAISPDGSKSVPIGDHGPKDIPIGTVRAIEKQTGVKLR